MKKVENNIIINDSLNINSNSNKVEEIYNYLNLIYSFEECESFFCNNQFVILGPFIGYLVNLSDYNTFKKNIKYDLLYKYLEKKAEYLCKEKIREYIELNKIEENIQKINIIDKKLSYDEMNQLKYKEEYKLINKNLANYICLNNSIESNEYFYELDYPELKIYFNKGKKEYIKFLYHDYIINNRLILNENDKDEVKKLYTAKIIVEYNLFCTNFHFKKNDDEERWYLINERDTVNLEKAFNNSEIDINMNNEDILYKVIDYINKDNVDADELLNINVINIKKKDEFKKCNEQGNIALINPKIYYIIKLKNHDNNDAYTFCSSKSGIITIKFKKSNEEIKYYPSNNILDYKRKINSKSIIRKIFSLKSWKNVFYYILKSLSHKNKKKDIKIMEDFEILNYEGKNNYEIKELDFEDNNNIINENNNIIEEEEDNNINNDIINKPSKNAKMVKNIKNLFKYCPDIGLQNIGATCYMNATLQCFAHIEKFVNFFKYNSQVDNYQDNMNKNKLYSSFKILIEKLWPDNYENIVQKYYAPYEFKKKIADMNDLFKGIAANDSKDLVNFIIMTLHEELNRVKTNIIINNEIIDQTNKELVLQNFAKEFTEKNQSIISDIFYAMNCTITECCNCHVKLYNYQIYFFLIFPLEEVRKFKFNSQFNNNQNDMNNQIQIPMVNNFFLNNSKTVNIYDCFDYDKKISLMSDSNAMYCNNCKLTSNCTMQTHLVAGPEILILLLNRGKGKEFDVKINFYEELNLINYIEYKDTGYLYELIGVITHIGESGMSGHFIAYCKDPIKYLWHKYNDAIVTQVNNFQNEVIDFAMPYLLFYQKKI